MKKFISLVVVIILTMSVLTGCEYEESTIDQEEAYTEQVKAQTLDAVGFPEITNHFEFAQLKEIYELRDDPELICYWYTVSPIDGKFVAQGKCIGYGIPYGASITNPEIDDYFGNGYYGTLPQAEPNGLYTNNVTSSATWVLSIGPDGNIYPVYMEESIAIFPYEVSEEYLSVGVKGLIEVLSNIKSLDDE